MAKEVIRLPEHLEASEKLLKEEKKIYQNLFTKSPKSFGGWTIYDRALYYFSKDQKTWYDAENFCMSRDAHLASILNDEEQNYLTVQLAEPFWIGLSDENVEGDWKWTDGSSLVTEFWSASNLSHPESRDTKEEDCAFINPSSRGRNWNKADCHTPKRWVCKESVDIERA
uniref:CD209 antigen-like protein C n=1 Tax=Pogona vitticeps TaxID=103695 RepID=A0A6J0TXV3_9SAUR